jgi:hypothetical protein
MMNTMLKGLALAAALAVIPTAASFAQPYYQPVPPPRYEPVPPPPGATYIWEPGHWHWNGVQYVWAPGHYVIRRAEYRRYVPGHWAQRGGGWVWIPAHWT